MTDGGDAMFPLDAAVWVLAAFVRTTASPDWTRPVADDEVTLADLALLDSAGVLARDGDGWQIGPVFRSRFPKAADDQIVAGVRSVWLQASAHAGGAGPGWSTSDAELIRAQGRASAMIPGLLDAMLIDGLAGTRNALDNGGWFLDVGVGSAALALAFADRFPTAHVVGIDVFDPALEVARREVLAAGRQDRVDIEHCSVADLSTLSQFDLAWLPQPFVPRGALLAGLARICAALRPGGWLVMPIADPRAADETGVEHLVGRLQAELVGGGTMSVDTARAALEDAGFTEITGNDLPVGSVMTARRPPR